jgi:hypothetical protein
VVFIYGGVIRWEVRATVASGKWGVWGDIQGACGLGWEDPDCQARAGGADRAGEGPAGGKSLPIQFDILRRLHHHYIVRYYDSFSDEEELVLIMEYCGGTLPYMQNAIWPGISSSVVGRDSTSASPW